MVMHDEADNRDFKEKKNFKHVFWHSIQGVFPLGAQFSGIGSRSAINLTGIKQLLKRNEWMNLFLKMERDWRIVIVFHFMHISSIILKIF